MRETEDKVRRQRRHYKPGRDHGIACGTKARRPVSTGDEWQVSCRLCLRAIAARKERGQVDLLGNAA